MSKSRKPIGTQIKAARESAGLSQMDVCRATGITSGGLSMIESNHRTPSLKTLRAIAKVLDRSIEMVPLK